MTPQELLGSVISLAVQGKLVPQLEVEGSADALYNHLVNQKQKLIKQGFAKKSKTLSPISEEEILTPMDLMQRYQEERASLNAEIDRVLAELSALLGGAVE